MPDFNLPISEYLKFKLPAVQISGIALDSRLVKPGDIFIALVGRKKNALEFAPQAVKNGASMIFCEALTEHNHKSMIAGVPVVKVDQLAAKVSALAGIIYHRPAEQLVTCGITGTNGKTSVADLVYQLIHLLQGKAGYIGTLGAYTQTQQIKTGLTTPNAVVLQAILAEFVTQQVASAAIEVSSHAIAQHRAAAIHFDSLVFTNLSHEHLDYHGTMQAYFNCKLSLFTENPTAAAVINLDDEWGQRLANRLFEETPSRKRVLVSTQGNAKPAEDCLTASEIKSDQDGFSFNLNWQHESLPVQLNLLAAFNIHNFLQAVAVLLLQGYSLAEIVAKSPQLTAVAGRMQRYKNANDVFAVVDFAHTPDALEQSLLACRAHCQGRLHLVFGCGGDRDREKRPLMGKIASRLADTVYLTNDNPRSEDPQAIIADIQSGFSKNTEVECILDRQLCIRQAIKQSKSQDWVLIAGKGHETEQIFAEQRIQYDERAFVSQLMKEAI